MSESPLQSPPRLPIVDMARGVAIAAMVVYHFSWDLAYVGFVDWDVVGDPLWRAFAMTIAGSFLGLVGVSLALAGRGGLDGVKALLRLAKIAAAAAAISLATLFAFPDSWIYFGILHMIAVGSLLALPFLALPAAASLAAALAVLAVRHYAPDAIDGPLGWVLGLSSDVPPANDYVPVFPWMAAVLAGLFLGKLIASGRLALPQPAERGAGRLLAVAGRWSLVIYLVHQPLLLGATMAAGTLLPADAGVERERFARICSRECQQTGGDGARCDRFCGCVATAMDGTSFWSVRGGDPALGSVLATALSNCRSGETFDLGPPP